MRQIARFGNLFWGLSVGVIVLYGFFVAMGGFSPGDVIGLTAAVVVLGVLYLVHTLRLQQQMHDQEGLIYELHRARERRGF